MNTKVKLGLVAAAIIVLLVAIFFGMNFSTQQDNFIKEKDPQLTQEERKIYEDRLAEANEALKNQNLDNDERYNWVMFKGFQLHGLGKLEDALKQFIEASKLKPEDSTAQVSLYTVYLDMQDNESARESIKKAIELKPTDPDIWKKYILLEKERFNASNELLTNLYSEALSKTNNHVDIITAYATFLEEIGNLQAAKEYWQKAVEANPGRRSLYEEEIKRLEAKMQQ